MIEQGRGEKFRQPSLVERVGGRVGAWLPGAVRRPASRVYARLLSRMATQEFVARLPGGECVSLVPSHRYLAWNREEYEAFRADVRPGDVVLDVGANAGAYTVLFAHWAGRQGRVFAFEPAQASLDALRRMLALNGVADRVTVLAQAVSGCEGTSPFQAQGSDGANRLLSIESPDATFVETTTIDAFCQRIPCSPGLIKIDVEGAELEVLRGARRTIAAGPDLRIYCEMHPRLWPEFNVTRADIEAELAAQGLRAERLDGRPDAWALEGVCLRLVRCGS